MPRATTPVVLTVAGSDSGGGAGLQADLKTFFRLGVHGTCAVTCLTAQNSRRVLGLEPCSPAMVRRQIEAVVEEFQLCAVKTGMLYSSAIVREVARLCKRGRLPAPVVDPVMVSTSGTRLLSIEAIRTLWSELLPLAVLVTPNVHETEVLTGEAVRSVEDLRKAAKAINKRFGCAALVKGGHLPGLKLAADIFYDGRQELLLSAPFVRGVRLHGTGCTYSAAIAACLARGLALPRAVVRAKRYITEAIALY